jgi:hypothetical protein
MGSGTMKHLSEQAMVEAYYGSLPESAARHLAECEECRAIFERQSAVLDAVRGYPVPERGPGYGGEVWARVLPHLERPKQLWWRVSMLVPAVAALLALAFVAGRWTERSTAVAGIPEKARERVLLLSLSEHLERSQIVLSELANGNAASTDLLEERERARELIGANRLLRQTAERLGDRKDAAVLEDLEHVLLEVANAPDMPTTEDAARVQRTIAQNELLFKVRITSTDARERGLRL